MITCSVSNLTSVYIVGLRTTQYICIATTSYNPILIMLICVYIWKLIEANMIHFSSSAHMPKMQNRTVLNLNLRLQPRRINSKMVKNKDKKKKNLLEQQQATNFLKPNSNFLLNL